MLICIGDGIRDSLFEYPSGVSPADGFVQTFMWMTEDNIVEVSFDK